MPIEKIETKTFLIRYRCDECGVGFMKWEHSNPSYLVAGDLAQWGHVCSKCGAKKNFIDVTYPHEAGELIND